ncbi:MAG: hypothetical protein HKN25_04095 [Pyrinomonadaceae bacterium]|nr:hypothetical protein [Pyrinomonadaceae bacterium]
MRALFLILCVFASLMVGLGYSARTSSNNPLGNALMFGGIAIYLGILITWILFKIKERGEQK